jgi:acyl carrier protein
MLEKVLEIIKQELEEEFHADTSIDALDLDSLEFLSLIVSLRELGNIPDSEIPNLHTPADIVRVLEHDYVRN